MKKTCNICGVQACTCNGSVCDCGYDAVTIRNMQKTEDSLRVAVTQNAIKEKALETPVCVFEGSGPRSKCVKCGQYKFYATGHPCQIQ